MSMTPKRATPQQATIQPDAPQQGVVSFAIYSDLICPWCYLGKRRLEEGLRLAGIADARIAWLPYELNPSMPEEGMDRAAYLDGKFGPGKRADIVIWSASPFSVYARAEQVFIDGSLSYDRSNPAYQPTTDFELGQPGFGRMPTVAANTGAR
jgi:hypothetical protein